MKGDWTAGGTCYASIIEAAVLRASGFDRPGKAIGYSYILVLIINKLECWKSYLKHTA
jgi:hypothetical protein